MIHDSLTHEEMQDYMAHHEPELRHIRHTKECLGCGDAGGYNNWNGQLCRECQHNKEAFEGNR